MFRSFIYSSNLLLINKTIKGELISTLCHKLHVPDVKDELLALNNTKLAAQLITGTYLKQNTLNRYLSKNKFALPPLPNLFFTRDSAMVINKKVVKSFFIGPPYFFSTK